MSNTAAVAAVMSASTSGSGTATGAKPSPKSDEAQQKTDDGPKKADKSAAGGAAKPPQLVRFALDSKSLDAKWSAFEAANESNEVVSDWLGNFTHVKALRTDAEIAKVVAEAADRFSPDELALIVDA